MADLELKEVNGETPTSRLKRMDDAVTQAQTGGGDIKTDFIAFLKKPRTAKQKRDLQVQLNDVPGLTSTKNTARDKLRLRQIRDKNK